MYMARVWLEIFEFFKVFVGFLHIPYPCVGYGVLERKMKNPSNIGNRKKKRC